MLSPILPITTPPQTSSSSKMAPSSAMAATMFLRSDDASSDDYYVPLNRLSVSSLGDDHSHRLEVKPLLPRSSSFNSINTRKGSTFLNQWRRRGSGDNSPESDRRSDGQGLSNEVAEVAVDTYRITRLGFTLLRYLGVGYRWVLKFLALGCYAFLLFPGFVQVGYYYFFSRQIRRGVVYGDEPRNRLDLYLPKDTNGPKPVVAFVTGGAWIIGTFDSIVKLLFEKHQDKGKIYKAWGSLLGQQLSERDVIVACIDYRNFPQGTMSDMVKDASQGISFVCNNIAEYGGDPNRIFLMGQSAGAHIAACALLDQAIKESSGERTTWSVSQIRSYFGLSGGIMEGELSLRRFSPEVMLQDSNITSAASLLPPIVLFHGTADYSIPCDASTTFADTLQRAGVKAESILYEGKTHTDLFLQDPMRGGADEMFDDLVRRIHAGDAEALAKHAAAPPRRRLVPEFMLKLARRVSPF
uniref:protein-S-isoprenylcysteine alpha-carbonyl methylesterase n=1 Tax=Daucus carota subsp. sativus TaxID=79200 RepID=A0A166ECG9_DAUCS